MSYDFKRLSVVLIAVSIFSLNAHSSEATIAKRSRGYFISIDGMSPTYLKALVKAKMLKGRRGLGWLYDHSLRAERAVPVDTSLTAVSHVSTITCSHPSAHGIYANSFLSDGKILSGFGADIGTETLWQAARRQGRKVISIGYVGTDGRTPARTVDYGVAFPIADYLGKSQTVAFDVTKLAKATQWKLDRSLHSKSGDMREAQVEIQLNGKTGESRTVNVLFIFSAGKKSMAYFDEDKDLTNGFLDKVSLSTNEAHFANLYFIESNELSPLKGHKRRTFVRAIPAPAGTVTLYFSKNSYNYATPESYRQFLDDAGLVWPDEDMPLGTSVPGTNISPSEFVESSQLLSGTMAAMTKLTMEKFPSDLVLLYQHLLDSMGHKYESALPQPFNPENHDPVTKAYVEGFKIIDQNISSVLEEASDDDVEALMGDHAMDPVDSMVNMAVLVPGLEDRVQFVSSGSLTMMYANSPQTNIDLIGEQLNDALKKTTKNGKPVLGTAYSKTSTPAGAWNYGQAQWAFTSGAGFILKYASKDPVLFGVPYVAGMHGQDVELPAMSTAFMMHSEKVKPQVIAKMSLIDAVPTFAKVFGIEPPAHCSGKSLLP